MLHKKIRFIILGMVVFCVYYLARIFGHISTLEFMIHVFLIGLLIKMTGNNMRSRLLEDEFTIPAMGLGAFANVLMAIGPRHSYWYHGIVVSVEGLFIGGFSIWLYGYFGKLVFKAESVGGGDIKLVAAIGAFLGPLIIWYLPIWICVLFALGFSYRVIGMMLKKTPDSSLPSAPIHLFALVLLLLLIGQCFDLSSALICLGILCYTGFIFAFYKNA